MRLKSNREIFLGLSALITSGGFLSTAYALPPPRPEVHEGWVRCADEDGFCELSAGYENSVRFGANGQFFEVHGKTGLAGRGIDCNRAEFGGDPVPNVRKYCEYFVTDYDFAETQDEWTICSEPNAECNFPDNHYVAFREQQDDISLTTTIPLSQVNATCRENAVHCDYRILRTEYDDDDDQICFLADHPSNAERMGGCVEETPLMTTELPVHADNNRFKNDNMVAFLNGGGTLTIKQQGSSRVKWNSIGTTTRGAELYLTRSGNLEVRDNLTNRTIWESGTRGSNAKIVSLRISGSDDPYIALECLNGEDIWRTEGSSGSRRVGDGFCGTGANDQLEVAKEIGERVAITGDTLCSDSDSEVREFCPAVHKYQIIQQDSKISVHAKWYDWIRFWSENQNEYDPKCLSNNSGNTTWIDCFDSDDNPIAATFFEEVPDAVMSTNNQDVGAHGEKMPLYTYSGQNVILNSCERVKHDRFFLSSNTSFRRNRSKSEFLERYFTDLDCALSYHEVVDAIKPYAEYASKWQEFEAIGLHVAHAAETFIAFSVFTDFVGPFAGPLMESLLLDSEIGESVAYGLKISENVVQAVGYGQLIGSFGLDFAKLGKCKSSACRIDTVTDLAINSYFLYDTVKGARSLEGSENIEAESYGESMVGFDENYTDSAVSVDDVPVKYQKINKIMQLSSKISEDLPDSHLDLLSQLPDHALTESFLHEYTETLEDIRINGSRSDYSINSLRDDLEDYVDDVESNQSACRRL